MMTTWRARRADSGYSLVEMLVTVLMFTLIAGSITTVVITSLKHQTSLGDRNSVLAATRTSLEQIDRDIRSANPLCAASSTEITMLETPVIAGVPKAWIVDYRVVTSSTGSKIVYTKYLATGTIPPGGATVTCNELVLSGAIPSTTPVYETGSALSTRTVVSNLVNLTTAVFSAPSAATFSTCPGGAALPASVSSITALTVNVSVQPSTLKSAVAVSDCGTYLRNSAVPTT